MPAPDVTTVERVMTQLQQKDPKGEIKALLQDIITSLREPFEMFMGVFLWQTTHTEYFDVEPNVGIGGVEDHTYFTLQGRPVVSITSVANTLDDDYANNLLSAGADYNTPKGNSGRLVIRASLTEGIDALRVVYVGGMATSTDELVQNFPNVAQAGAIQAAHMYQRRKDIGTKGVAGAGGTVTIEPDIKLLPIVKKLLAPRKTARTMIG